jgi:anti-anti-sigma factor
MRRRENAVPMPNELFRIFDEQSASVLELRLAPEMDALLMDSIVESVAAHLQRRGGGPWVLDLTAVNYLNSAGLGLLVNIRHKIRAAKGRLAICGLSPAMLELFRSCCLEQLFTIVKTRQDALSAVK